MTVARRRRRRALTTGASAILRFPQLQGRQPINASIILRGGISCTRPITDSGRPVSPEPRSCLCYRYPGLNGRAYMQYALQAAEGFRGGDRCPPGMGRRH